MGEKGKNKVGDGRKSKKCRRWEIAYHYTTLNKEKYIIFYIFQIDALPDIVSAVSGRIEVYVDGGVRTGGDVIKALALGADAVFVGRPAIWGLATQVTL